MKTNSQNAASEFYDRDYTKAAAYGRLWAYVRPYRMRLFLGILSGMLMAGTLVPLFQLVRPATMHIEGGGARSAEPAAADTMPKEPAAVTMPKELATAEKYAKKLGIELVDKNGVMHGGIVLLIIVVLPLAAGLRLALKFCNQYCLSWVGAHATMDISCDLFRHAQRMFIMMERSKL